LTWIKRVTLTLRTCRSFWKADAAESEWAVSLSLSLTPFQDGLWVGVGERREEKRRERKRKKRWG